MQMLADADPAHAVADADAIAVEEGRQVRRDHPDHVVLEDSRDRKDQRDRRASVV